MAYALRGVGASRAAVRALPPPRLVVPSTARRRPRPAVAGWGGGGRPGCRACAPWGWLVCRGGVWLSPLGRSLPVRPFPSPYWSRLARWAPEARPGPPPRPPWCPLGWGGGCRGGGGVPVARPPVPGVVLLASASPSVAEGRGGGGLVPGAVLPVRPLRSGRPLGPWAVPSFPLLPRPPIPGGGGGAGGAGAGGGVLVGCAPPSLRALFRRTPPRARTSSGLSPISSESASSLSSSRSARPRRPATRGGRRHCRLCRGSSSPSGGGLLGPPRAGCAALGAAPSAGAVLPVASQLCIAPAAARLSPGGSRRIPGRDMARPRSTGRHVGRVRYILAQMWVNGTPKGPDHMCLYLKMLRFLWRLQIWVKNLKKIEPLTQPLSQPLAAGPSICPVTCHSKGRGRG